ncbi:MAG: rRNA pseudouridine synthase [Dehalococcoidales bacterium]|nr:rRNA pseudouridine synthase [Dehalococcoidales bacterium]
MPKKPLIKALTDAGIGSRRRMADAIKQGSVEVNGTVAESFNHPVDPARDSVYLNGQKISLKAEEVICIMLNKPGNIVSTVTDDRGRTTVMDILPAKFRKQRLYPVGRLDMNTTGLLLLTNNGDLTYRLTHPKFEQEKEYLVRMDGKLLTAELRQLERGITLEDGPTYPAAVKRLFGPDYNYRIVIHEGRKRQVRRMFQHLGHRVTALRRVRVGNLVLGDLAEGDARPLTNREVKALTNPLLKNVTFSNRRRV